MESRRELLVLGLDWKMYPVKGAEQLVLLAFILAGSLTLCCNCVNVHAVGHLV